MVPLVGGETVDLAQFRGKPVWLTFMATWCPSCRDELPLMAGYAAKYEKQGLVVLAVDVKEDEPTIAGYFGDLGILRPGGRRHRRRRAGRVGRGRAPGPLLDRQHGIVRDGALGGIGPNVMNRASSRSCRG